MLIDRKDGIPDFVAIGRKYLKVVHRNLPTPLLYEQIIKNREGQVSYGTGCRADRRFCGTVSDG